MKSMKSMKRREQVYEFIVTWSEKHLGNFPSYRVVMAGCDIPSSSTIHYYLAQLLEQGKIVIVDGCWCVAGSRWLRPVSPVTYAETEIEPTEAAPDGNGNAQAHGIRPGLPHGRAVDDAPSGPTWKRRGPAPAVAYCPRCGVALPTRRPPLCESCGNPILWAKP